MSISKTGNEYSTVIFHDFTDSENQTINASKIVNSLSLIQLTANTDTFKKNLTNTRFNAEALKDTFELIKIVAEKSVSEINNTPLEKNNDDNLERMRAKDKNLFSQIRDLINSCNFEFTLPLLNQIKCPENQKYKNDAWELCSNSIIKWMDMEESYENKNFEKAGKIAAEFLDQYPSKKSQNSERHNYLNEILNSSKA